MFPLSDSIKSKSFPIFTLVLIGINVYVFLQELAAPSLDAFISHYSLIPALVNFSNPKTFLPFVTAMFLHGGFFHVISNMWFLWVFADDVEGHLGKIPFLLLYLGAGLIGNFAQYVLNPTSAIPMLGASGAVSGILGAYYILFPHSRIKTLLPIFFFITIVEIPAVVYLFYWFIIQLFSGIASLPVNFTGGQGGIAFWAHIGGFVTGILFAKTFGGGGDKGYIEGEIVE